MTLLDDAAAMAVPFVKTYEGFVATPYNDNGNTAIGYGHTLHTGPPDGKEPAEFRAGITPARAAELLSQDLQRAMTTITEGFSGIRFLPQQLAALASFTFNVGSGWLSDSGLAQALRAGNLGDVRFQFMRWVNPGSRYEPGLRRRRAAEANMFEGRVAQPKPEAGMQKKENGLTNEQALSMLDRHADARRDDIIKAIQELGRRLDALEAADAPK